MKVYRIETGKVRIKSSQLRVKEGWGPGLFKILTDKQWSSWLPIYAWVIDHPEGIIIVDTGDTYKTGTKGYLPKWHPYYALAVEFDIKYNEEIGPQLERMGISPINDVRKVILTHLHTDHAGGMHHFPNAEFIIEKKEFRTASGITGILAGYLPHRWPHWLKPTLVSLPRNPYGPFSNSLKVTADGRIVLVATPGHVSNHMSVIVKVEDLYYFLAGDASYTEENMLHTIPDGIGTKESITTLRKIQKFALSNPTIYLPSHDPKGAQRMDNKEIVPLYRATQPV